MSVAASIPARPGSSSREWISGAWAGAALIVPVVTLVGLGHRLPAPAAVSVSKHDFAGRGWHHAEAGCRRACRRAYVLARRGEIWTPALRIVCISDFGAAPTTSADRE